MKADYAVKPDQGRSQYSVSAVIQRCRRTPCPRAGRRRGPASPAGMRVCGFGQHVAEDRPRNPALGRGTGCGTGCVIGDVSAGVGLAGECAPCHKGTKPDRIHSIVHHRGGHFYVCLYRISITRLTKALDHRPPRSMENVMQIIYFNSKIMDSIITEVRRISWASILMAFVIGYQQNSGYALVVGSGLWCVSQILAFILQTQRQEKGGVK